MTTTEISDPLIDKAAEAIYATTWLKPVLHPWAEADSDPDAGDPDVPEECRMKARAALSAVADDLRAEGAREALTTRHHAHALARHQIAEHLPFGLACLCGAELSDMNPPLDDATVTGRGLALAVHQLQALATEGER